VASTKVKTAILKDRVSATLTKGGVGEKSKTTNETRRNGGGERELVNKQLKRKQTFFRLEKKKERTGRQEGTCTATVEKTVFKVGGLNKQ